MSIPSGKSPAGVAAAILRSNSLFRDLPADALERIAALGNLRTFGKGATIFSQGDPGDALYAVAAGRVRISAAADDGRVAYLNIIEPGDSFGEIAVMDGAERTAGATALEECRLVVIQRADFLALIEKESSLALQLLKLLCARLRWTSELVEDSAFLPGAARLAKRVLTLAAIDGQQMGDRELELRISQNELASFCGVSRQIVNQTLTEWRQQGWVRVTRGRIAIVDRQALIRQVRAGVQGT